MSDLALNMDFGNVSMCYEKTLCWSVTSNIFFCKEVMCCLIFCGQILVLCACLQIFIVLIWCVINCKLSSICAWARIWRRVGLVKCTGASWVSTVIYHIFGGYASNGVEQNSGLQLKVYNNPEQFWYLSCTKIQQCFELTSPWPLPNVQ